jgi:hypothetical protein
MLKNDDPTPNGADGDLMEVHIAPNVLDRMKRAAMLFPNDETGEALVGVMIPPEKKKSFPAMTVLETIPPMQNAIREWAMFSQGDDWQGAIFNWLNENWEVYRALRRQSYGKSAGTQWDLPLVHLGDWHKQPGMVKPSNGDFHTAKDFMKDNDQDYLLTPIVTWAEDVSAAIEANSLVFEDVHPAVRIDFWGIGRKNRDFLPLKPVASLGYGLPRLPDVVWWLHDSQRMDLEIAALEKAGLTVMDIAQYNADGMPPLETCFAIYRPGTSQVILAITPHTYPKKAPMWRTAPLIRPDDERDWFEMLYETSKPVPGNWVTGWSGDSHALIDGVRLIEAHLTEGGSE